MSLWLRDEHRIVLHQDQVELVSVRREFTRRGLKRRVLDKRVLSCDAVAGETPWGDALRVLETALSGMVRRNSHATVIVANQFMRYALIPWNEALSDEREETIFARHAFREMYGGDADSWELRINPGNAGMAQLACAVDARLLEALRELFGRLGVGLRSIQPHLMTAYNSCRTILRDRSAWLVLVERNNLCLALLQEGKWSWVRTVRIDVKWREGMSFFLEREAFLVNGGMDTDEVFLWVPERHGETLPPGKRWRFRYLQPPAMPSLVPEGDRQFAMYLGGWPL